jgi:hypothetical protein
MKWWAVPVLVASSACGGGVDAAPRVAAAGPTEPDGPAATPDAVRCDPPLPTFSTDVRPILARRCARCHTGDGAAAEDHDWSRLEILRAQRRSLVDDVAARTMPPAGQPALSETEAQTLLLWGVCGAPE